jgi:thioredoxin 1
LPDAARTKSREDQNHIVLPLMKNFAALLLTFWTLAPVPTMHAAEPVALPRLLDLGAGKCMPCKQMVPVLAALKADYAGRLEVVFIDVWENPDAGKAHAIRMIPTQILYDATGREIARHEGFWSQKAILAKFAELGVTLAPPATALPSAAPSGTRAP